MSKKKTAIKHGFVIHITGTTNFKLGDEVVVVEPLAVPLLSSRTGKVLGMNEKVLGRGKIADVDGSLVVEVSQVMGELQKEVKRRTKYNGRKIHRATDVLVKLVNGRMIEKHRSNLTNVTALC